MSKRLVAKVGEYTKEGETKGEYVRVGVILSNENGEYALIDPTVSLAGTLQKQNRYNHGQNKKVGDMLMCSVFDDDNRQQSAPQKPSNADADLDDGGDIPF